MGKRSLKWTVVVVLAAFAGGFAAQLLVQWESVAEAAGEKIVKAKAFVVVDEAGREVVLLGSRPDGAGLLVRDGEQKDRMVLGMLPEGQFGLVINSPEGNTQVALGAWEKTNHMDLYDAERRPRFTVGVARDGSGGGLAFYDRRKAERLAIGMGPGGGGDFVIKNGEGEDLWRASHSIHHEK